MTQTYTPPPPATSATFGSIRRALVAVWAVMTLGAFSFVAFIGTNAPYADEWDFVPALLGDEPAGPWLWQQHNEHRMVLPRVVVLTYFWLTHDFRTGMVLQVATLSILALVLMNLAADLRGKPHWADAFFPVSLLHIGHWENFVMGYQVCFVMFAVFATVLVVTALRITPVNAFRSGTIAGVILALVALTGGSGLVVVPPVSGWVAFIAVNVWRAGSKSRAVFLLLLAVLPLVYLGLYFQGYHKPSHHPPLSTDPIEVGCVSGEVLAMSFGIGLSGVWWAVAGGLVVVGGLTVALLVERWKESGERLSIVGLIAVAAGVTGVALAIGVGRGGWGTEMGLWSRYSMLVWPLLAATYLVWTKFGRKWVPIGLCVVSAFAFPGNVGTGILSGATIVRDYAGIAAQAQSGFTAEEIVAAEPFSVSHQCGQPGGALRAIPLLRRDRIGIFAR
ncbi:Putative uncharacterized protein OS=[Oscillatoria] sp. PCC 6506 GN=OSCI_3720052 PE=4 SV=1 [Gemmata massiliana]|uniref:Glycosyltransferase RgtA/B/C/D-like domain-containing protein n=1 Tax=Gemmata massiliana TaxID=1210884 RepID=A0A6P2CS86_9BACT|nr:hypothetical protein [Gemmata massiliana]VTR91781.1 Putative uncharacterized protein OS=[Oscillatoria] sp. PCC 6506 GN=OSCI_3720052 PE=4 SV=1 [Gemmata massiliana]